MNMKDLKEHLHTNGEEYYSRIRSQDGYQYMEGLINSLNKKIEEQQKVIETFQRITSNYVVDVENGYSMLDIIEQELSK